jgi:hypothetical protein
MRVQAEPDVIKPAVEIGLLCLGVGRTADRAGTEKDRIRSAHVIEALGIIGVERVADIEEIAHGRAGCHPAHRGI